MRWFIKVVRFAGGDAQEFGGNVDVLVSCVLLEAAVYGVLWVDGFEWKMVEGGCDECSLKERVEG